MAVSTSSAANIPVEKIGKKVHKNQVLTIVVKSNPTTGYMWNATWNKKYMKLISMKYVPDKPIISGSGGKQIFKFKAIKKGKTKIKLFYARSWEVNPIKIKLYSVKITKK